MVGIERALYSALTGDDIVGTVGSGSTASVVVVDDASLFATFDQVYVTGSGATLANNRAVRTVSAVDTGANTVTVSPDLSAAPVSTDTIGKGVVGWMLTAASLYYARWPDEIPARDLLSADSERRCVLSYGPVSGAIKTRFWRWDPRYEVRVYSRDSDSAAGCGLRIQQLLDGNPSALSVAGGTVKRLRAELVRPQIDQQDQIGGLWQYVVPVDIGVVRAVA